MPSFHELVLSRREWIDQVLRPWCRSATRRELLLAEQEWVDLAGKAAPEMTLWHWAWSRFPALGVEALASIDETAEVLVHCRDGRTARGFPDARQSERGQLVLVADEGAMLDPISIDEISAIEKAPR